MGRPFSVLSKVRLTMAPASDQACFTLAFSARRFSVIAAPSVGLDNAPPATTFAARQSTFTR